MPASLKKILLAFLACLAWRQAGFAYDIPSASNTPHVDFEADRAEYFRSEDRMNLKGKVRLVERNRGPGLEDRTARGEEFTVYNSSHIFVSSGAVLVTEGLNAVYGEQGVFNWETKYGELYNVTGSFGPWRILDARRGQMRDKKNIFKGASFTSCDKKKPDYHVGASRMVLVPNEYLWGLNGVFYLGKIPVFYLPFFYKSLGNDAPYVTYLEFGADERLGAFARSTIYHRVNKYFTSKLFLDYFSKQTFGTGMELTYNNPANLTGTINAYRIKEPGNPVQRWGLYGGYWYKMYDTLSLRPDGELYYAQGQTRMVSDPFFNNDYARNNPYAVSPDRESSLAVVRQTNKLTTRVSYYGKAEMLSGTNYFTKTKETLPRFDFSVAPFTIGKTPFLHTVTGFYDKSLDYYSLPGFYQNSAGGRWTIRQAIPVARGLSLTPSVYYDDYIAFAPKKRDGTGFYRDQRTDRYGASLNLRYQSLIGDTDITQYYQRRLKTNTFSVDKDAADYGEDANNIAVQNIYRPDRRVYFKMASGYDFRKIRGQSRPNDDRIAPVLSEVQYTPSLNLSFFAQNYYKIRQGNQAFILQADLGQEGANSMSFGLANYKTDPGDYVVTHLGHWYPGGKDWHLAAGLNYILRQKNGLDFSDFILFGKTITLYKDFHDFRTSWTIKLRPGVRTFSFRLSLKFNTVTTRTVSDREAEKFWYPWRETTDGEIRD